MNKRVSTGTAITTNNRINPIFRGMDVNASHMSPHPADAACGVKIPTITKNKRAKRIAFLFFVINLKKLPIKTKLKSLIAFKNIH